MARALLIAVRLHEGRFHGAGERGVDMAWATAETLDAGEADASIAAHPGALRRPGGAGDTPAPMSGSLDSLRRRHAAFRARFGTSRGKRVFSQPPKALMRRIGYDAAPRRHVFALRDDEGAFHAQPLASAAPLTAALRDAAVARLAGALPDQAAAVRRLLGGDGAGPADKARRVRLIPLPSIGHAEAFPSIRRLAVEVPADCPMRAENVAWAFSGLAPFDAKTGEATARGRLSAFEEDRMLSAYAGRAAAWRTVTAAALPGASRRRIDPDDRGASTGRWVSLSGRSRAAPRRRWPKTCVAP